MEYDDRKWCRRHHIQYPKQLGHKAHSQVKDWKKIVREETKEEIRKELLSNATKT
jgi:tRNA G37 N-methylase TrmD